MKRRDIPAHIVRELCNELHDDDGTTPRRRERCTGDRAGHAERKQAQLCAQVGRVIQLTISNQLSDEALRQAEVVGVEPHPTVGTLLISVRPARTPQIPPEEVLRRIRAAGGILRDEVAAAISRKRTPVLVFRLAAPNAAEVAP